MEGQRVPSWSRRAAEAEVAPVNSCCPDPVMGVPEGLREERRGLWDSFLLKPQVQTFAKPVPFLLLLFLLVHAQPGVPVRNSPPPPGPISQLTGPQARSLLTSPSAGSHCLCHFPLLSLPPSPAQAPSLLSTLLYSGKLKGKKSSLTAPSEDPKTLTFWHILFQFCFGLICFFKKNKLNKFLHFYKHLIHFCVSILTKLSYCD